MCPYSPAGILANDSHARDQQKWSPVLRSVARYLTSAHDLISEPVPTSLDHALGGLMRHHVIRASIAGLIAIPLLTSGLALAQETNPGLSAAMAEYKRKLAAWHAAYDPYEAIATPYWNSIAEKRKLRFAKRRNGQTVLLEDYVLTQPPVYSGPPKPVDPSAPIEERKRKYIPVVADLRKAAKQHFDFVPQTPANELEYKRAYVQVASAAGLTREQAVRVYVFEAGGNGLYDVQAGLERSKEGRAISTAIGYNQLLTTNSVEVLAEEGHTILKALNAKAATLTGPAKAALDKKIAIVHRMYEFCRTVPDDWKEHQKLGETEKGWAVHALNLDVDVGPHLQTHKLLTSVIFAKRKGYTKPLSAAELEMMNLTGDGNGYDIVVMPLEMRDKVPTSNFFQRGGYERNPVASRNNTVAKLLAATDGVMERGLALQGAKDLVGLF